jgi:predicted nucleic acid-binding protein
MSIGPFPPDISLALDNDVLNNWRTGNPTIVGAITNYVRAAKAPPALTAITVFEMMHGFENTILRKGASERLERDLSYVRELTRECLVLPFNQEAAEIAAYIFPRLSRKEQKDHGKDVFMAATVVAHEYGIATRNKRDFELIGKYVPPHYPPLRIAVWK